MSKNTELKEKDQRTVDTPKRTLTPAEYVKKEDYMNTVIKIVYIREMDNKEFGKGYGVHFDTSDGLGERFFCSSADVIRKLYIENQYPVEVKLSWVQVGDYQTLKAEVY